MTQLILDHPLLPLLQMGFQKLELATSSNRDGQTESIFSAEEFLRDIREFVNDRRLKNIPLSTGNHELDQFMFKAIEVKMIQILELEKVHQLCDNFCHRYINCLKGKLPIDLVVDDGSSREANSATNNLRTSSSDSTGTQNNNNNNSTSNLSTTSTPNNIKQEPTSQGNQNTNSNSTNASTTSSSGTANTTTNNYNNGSSNNDSSSTHPACDAYNHGAAATAAAAAAAAAAAYPYGAGPYGSTYGGPYGSAYAGSYGHLSHAEATAAHHAAAAYGPIQQCNNSSSTTTPQYPTSHHSTTLSMKQEQHSVSNNNTTNNNNNSTNLSTNNNNSTTNNNTNSNQDMTSNSNNNNNHHYTTNNHQLHDDVRSPTGSTGSFLGDASLGSGDGTECEDDDNRGRRQQKKRGIFPKAATNIMRSWLFQHLNHPYPSEDQKKQLAEETGLTILQVNNWFINARRRIVQPMIDQSHRASNNMMAGPAYSPDGMGYMLDGSQSFRSLPGVDSSGMAPLASHAAMTSAMGAYSAASAQHLSQYGRNQQQHVAMLGLSNPPTGTHMMGAHPTLPPHDYY